ncbi:MULTISPECIES: MucBP domain-containing protein [unclassified Enterococcus]|uniref:MucBP domain-containing protein n=1 Tax=unclassified Enterococcus TaxID=2608891 RepID=UPI0015537DD3|nr:MULTISPECIES: MucBP domain-containing protein [unclassified Enterococcus]MBS7575928.1 MucBP domain-containing protein [Enterococcus sp. MMGLQ5-2]MBS7583161.1 MucBP domain-containing protein [Enterococcus sp. MMGLQ5-1]NPD11021.1 LPXTG cell wall anchor domain-containing protein [Enterococcus sp. MMGLQ5-1]NPD35764.1 LPXTG cell wall anchor domain-containing protein [Enterococcus sp. MMGLQ5-2]
MKKILVFFISFIMLLFGIILIGEYSVNAAENNVSTVSTDFVDYNSLSREQQNEITEGIPRNIIQHDSESFILVYKKIDSNSMPVAASLPKTSEQSKNIFLILGIIVMVVAMIFIYKFFKWQRNKIIILFIIATGTIGMVKNVFATNRTVFPDTKITLYSFGDIYSESIPEISGYQYFGFLHSFKDNQNPIPGANLTASYVDESGNQLVDSVILTGNIGDSFEAVQKDIEGYTFKEIQGNPTGTFTSEEQSVTFVYTRNLVPAANVIVNYIDETGTALSASVILAGNIGDSFEAVQKDIEGYTFKEVQGNPTGTFTSKEQSVTFVYSEMDQSAIIIVKFVDSYGNPFTIPDFSSLENGVFVTNHPNLSEYHTVLEYTEQRYEQNETVNEISIPARIGESYSLPNSFTFTIRNNLDNNVQLSYTYRIPNGYETITLYDYHSDVIPDDVSGVVNEKITIVTYKIVPYIIRQSVVSPED